ncbi:MBD domain-containing protein [Trichonephila clavipes]|uniref:MBD domain-containing protein n=1 Tax=Trichonephila clavipes TaxID=2585209 RepID=A0A8X6V7I3_TRICX|nr:MBD domain-containing protein [Trichonephila clavipes]
MSSSIFEVKETDSDSEKVLGFGLDTCEENGIVSTQSDGELPKDHTYTKEPDIVQEENVNENDLNNQAESSMNNNEAPVKKTRASRATKVEKPVAVVRRGKSKRKPPVKKETIVPKKAQSKKDDVIADIVAVTEDLVKEKTDEKVEEAAASEVESKPSKRGRKRKIEEKENVLDQDSTKEPAANSAELSQKKNTSSTKQKKRAVKEPKQKKFPDEGMIDNHNLPQGWLRKTVVRKSGKSAGQIDVYIYSPDGFKLRSRPDVAAYLQRTKSNLKVEDFDFSKKAVLQNPSIKPIQAEIPKKKPAPAKLKTPVKKKEEIAPKKTPKTLLVKIVSESRNKRATKRSPRKVVKENKTVAKGKQTLKAGVKGGKKKKNA